MTNKPNFETIADWWFDGLISREELHAYGYKEIRSTGIVWIDLT